MGPFRARHRNPRKLTCGQCRMVFSTDLNPVDFCLWVPYSPSKFERSRVCRSVDEVAFSTRPAKNVACPRFSPFKELRPLALLRLKARARNAVERESRGFNLCDPYPARLRLAVRAERATSPGNHRASFNRKDRFCANVMPVVMWNQVVAAIVQTDRFPAKQIAPRKPASKSHWKHRIRSDEDELRFSRDALNVRAYHFGQGLLSWRPCQ